MRNLVRIVDRHYRQSACINQRFLVKRSPDYVSGAPLPDLLPRVSALAHTLAINCGEFVRSAVGRRAPCFDMLSIEGLSVPGEFYGNLNNGTVVVHTRDGVDKLYTKDQSAYSEIYDGLARPQGWSLASFGEVLVLSCPRYCELDSTTDDLKLARAAASIIAVLQHRVGSIVVDREAFSYVAKVQQLFRLYERTADSATTAYVAAARELEAHVESCRTVLCHGDLWKPNLLQDRDGRIVLIDFDKAVRFDAAYDLIYFYLMSAVVPRCPDIHQLLVDRGSLFGELQDWLSTVNPSHKPITAAQILVNIIAFCLLKLTERDLRTDRVGFSLLQIEAAISELSERRKT